MCTTDAFIRALYEIWSQATQPDPMAEFIRAFLAVQVPKISQLHCQPRLTLTVQCPPGFSVKQWRLLTGLGGDQ